MPTKLELRAAGFTTHQIDMFAVMGHAMDPEPTEEAVAEPAAPPTEPEPDPEPEP